MSNNNIIKTKKTSKLGKLVNISLEYAQDSRKIHLIKITGDFFIHPEETIEKLENSLCGILLDRDILEEKIRSTLRNSQFYGFDEKSLADTIIEAKE